MLDSRDRTALEDRLLRVIVAGGDGTVMWCLSELEAHGINRTLIALGVMPFGTGICMSPSIHIRSTRMTYTRHILSLLRRERLCTGVRMEHTIITIEAI